MSDNKAPDQPTPLVGTPTDQTAKRRALAQTLITCATEMMRYMEQGNDASNEYTYVGLTFVDADFQGQPGLSHVNAQNMLDAMTNFINLRQYLRTNFIDDIFLTLKQ